MINISQTLQSLPPLPELQSLPELLRRFSEEQVQLYFFPLPKRPIRERIKKLLLWLALVVGLGIVFVSLYVRFIKPANTQRGITAIELFVVILATLVFILIIWLIVTHVIPLAQELLRECSEHLKEQIHLRRNPPPSEKEYERWIMDIRNKIYEMAPEKLHIPMSKEYKQWVEDLRAGLYEGVFEKWEFEADLQTSGFLAPSPKDSPLLNRSKPASRWAPGVGVMHYSINVFTRLFVTEDYIATYTNTVNVREPGREQEKCEHCYHQHLSYVALKIDSKLIEQAVVKDQYLSLKLDSGYTIKLNVATAELFYAGNREAKRDVDEIHGGLLDALREHKMSKIRSSVEAEKLEIGR
jgi:hypothetical protein